MMTADITFHYPPELFNLLIDTIALPNRSKKDLLLFFRGARVPETMLADLGQQLSTAANDINKFEIARTTLRRLNERGEATLRERRELLKRVVELRRG
jgi:restriction system protein